MSKAISFKMPNQPEAADAWIGKGIEPHLKNAEIAGVAPVTAPVAMKRFTIDVPLDLHSRVKTACAQRGKIMADEVRRLLEAEFPVGS